MRTTIATCYSSVNSTVLVPANSILLCNGGMENKEIRRANLDALIAQMGSAKAVADATDTDVTYIRNIKNNVRDMGDEIARRFEEKLHKPRGWMDALQTRPRHDDAKPPHNTAQERGIAEYGVGVSEVPVVGTAQLGDDGYWLELDYPTGHGEGFVLYPTRDQNTYALRVKGDSMRPRIKPGEFVVVEPNHAVAPGDEVLVKTADGKSMVKVLGSRRSGFVELLSINEDHRPITLDEEAIVSLHYIGGILKADLHHPLLR